MSLSEPSPADALRAEGDLNTSPARAAWADAPRDAATASLLARDEAVFLHQSLSTPCLNAVQGCQGAALEDLVGRRILDFHGNSLHQVGYGHPRVVEAIVRQMAALPFCPRRYTNAVAVAFAEALAKRAPGDLNRVLFAPGGAEAIGMALKLARAATGRHKTLSLWDSFHGASLDAISVGGEAIFRRDAGPLLPGCEHAPPPEPIGCPFRCGAACSLQCADYIAYVLEKEGDIAAIIAETVRCTPSIPPPGYWQRIREACDRHGTLLILDEIPTALGRTGRFFACEHYGVVPDMLVLGKGLGGGILPLAALLAREGLNAAMADRALGHYTHEKSPVCSAAGLATLAVIDEEGLIERSERLGRYALARLEALRAKHPLIAEVRGLGLLLGVVLLRDGAKATAEAERVMYAALRRGLSFKVTMGHILTLTPALTISEADLDAALDILDASLAEGCAPA